MTNLKNVTGVKAARVLLVLAGFAVAAFAACGDSGTEADRLGIGAQCTKTEDCQDEQLCLSQFKGGYCGRQGCSKNADCPAASACVRHDDGQNYCFRICAEKVDCNRNRSLDVEASCSSSTTLVEPGKADTKICKPPSGK